MGVLISSNQIVEDDWIKLDDDVSVGSHVRAIVSSGRLRAEWEILRISPIGLGVELEATDFIEEFEEYLHGLELVVLRFDSFADGRAFSQARLLRRRFGFTGTIRASGDVLRDQLAFMQRCGFDQFQLADSEEADLALAAVSDISLSYQPEPKRLTH